MKIKVALVADSSRMRRASGGGLILRLSRNRVIENEAKEVVDSELKRCRIRLPLTRSLVLIEGASG